MTPTFATIDGVQRELTGWPVIVDGVSRDLDQMFGNVDGVKREIFPGHDVHTLLLLHGDAVLDSSTYARALSNDGVALQEMAGSINSKTYYFDGKSKINLPIGDYFNFGDGDFTVDWREYVPASAVAQTVGITASNISTYFTVTNDAYYFKGVGGTFTSNNGGVKSSTAKTVLKAKKAGRISFSYSYSSEKGCDKFTLKVAGVTIADGVSGPTQNGTCSMEIAVGDTVEFIYSKDGSVNSNDDKCTFSSMSLRITDSIAPGNPFTFCLNPEEFLWYYIDGKIQLWFTSEHQGTEMRSITKGRWVHHAFVRQGSNLFAFEDGVLFWSGTVTKNSPYVEGYQMCVGGRSEISQFFYGYIEEFRVSDVARWTSSFTPPTEPYHA